MKTCLSNYSAKWSWLVRPAISLTDPIQQQQAKLLATWIIINVSLTILINIPLLLVEENYFQDTFPIVGPAVLMLCVAYLYSRTSSYQSGVFITLSTISIASLSSGYLHPAYLTMGTMAISFSLILASFFYSPKGVMIVGIINWMGLIVVVISHHQRYSPTEILTMILWVAVLSVLIVVWMLYRDMFHRQHYQQKAELELVRHKAAFLKDVLNKLSHDLKTPLSIIYTSLYLIERTSDETKRKEKLHQIKLQANHLEQIIQHILDASRLESELSLPRRSTQINTIVQELYEELLPLIEDKPVGFTVDVKASLPPILANRKDIKMALRNLIVNAINYTLEGSISVSASCLDAQVMIVICDTGIGISSSDLGYIFDHFFRADKARRIDTGGTGLGLAISKKIIEQHGGLLTVKSTIGKGSAFSIQIPYISTIDA